MRVVIKKKIAFENVHLYNAGTELDCSCWSPQLVRKESGHAATAAADDDDGQGRLPRR
jgi:hypothetical protein